MMFNYVLVLALAVFGASASFIAPGYVSNGFNTLNRGYGTFGTQVSDVCRCVKTVVRPHIRTEITAVPAVQRYVRTETTPVIERIPYSVSRRVDTPGFETGVLSGNFGGVISNGFRNAGVSVVSGVAGVNTGYGY